MSPYRPFFRLALIGVAVASLALAACGRKGSLESPPGYQSEAQPPAATTGLMGTRSVTPIGGQSKEDFAGVDSSGRAVAPKGQKKQLPLDVLLN